MKRDKILYQGDSSGRLPASIPMEIVGHKIAVPVTSDGCPECHGTGRNQFIDGLALKAMREERWVSRAKIARALKYSRVYIRHLENNHKPFTIERAVRYLNALYKLAPTVPK